jgi:hypothetical protein
VEVSVLLCDYADEVNGKLYIMGGGWSRLTMVQPMASMSLAVRIEVPWDQANIRHDLRAALVTEDGEPVMAQTEPPLPVKMEGKFEVGRPPGTTRGSPLVTAFTLRVESVPLDAGRYSWRIEIDNEEAAAARFEVLKGGES